MYYESTIKSINDFFLLNSLVFYTFPYHLKNKIIDSKIRSKDEENNNLIHLSFTMSLR